MDNFTEEDDLYNVDNWEECFDGLYSIAGLNTLVEFVEYRQGEDRLYRVEVSKLLNTDFNLLHLLFDEDTRRLKHSEVKYGDREWNNFRDRTEALQYYFEKVMELNHY